MPPYRFIAADLSMFSGKVRPVLRRKGLHFVEELATAERWQVCEKLTGNRMIPTVVTPEGQVLQDSSSIFDALEARHPEIPLLPRDATLRVVSRLLELVHDEFLPLLALYYRWVHPDAIPQGTARIQSMLGDVELGAAGARGMQSAAPFMGIRDATRGCVEAIYLDLLRALDAHLSAHRYLLGAIPTLADTGFVGGIYAHLFLDWAPHKLMWENGPQVCRWVQQTQLADPSTGGELLASSELPSTLLDLLSRLADDAAPWLLDVLVALEAGLDAAQPDAPLPRAFGLHDTSLRGVATQRATTPITLFKFQRLRDDLEALDDAERGACERLLSRTGWQALLRYAPRHRVGFRSHALVREH